MQPICVKSSVRRITVYELQRTPEREGFYFWKPFHKDVWHPVEMCYIQNWENGANGESVMAIQLLESGKMERISNFPDGCWAQLENKHNILTP